MRARARTSKLGTLLVAGAAVLVLAPSARADEAMTGYGEIATAETPASSVSLQLPKRPRPLLELGEDFNRPGTFSRGIRVLGGAVWRPQLLVYGSLRTAVQAVNDADGGDLSEFVARLDLSLNLRLSGTERFFLSVRPFDDGEDFTGYDFKGDKGWQECMNAEVRSFFFEGELGEMFPSWDESDRRALDLGLAIGRQPISFQQGMLVDDILDSAGFTKAALRPRGSSNFRVTGLLAWGQVHRAGHESLDVRKDDDARLLGVFTSTDLRHTTLDADLAWVSEGQLGAEGFVAGISATQRIGRVGSTFRILSSVPTHGDVPGFSRGTVLFSELTWAPRRNHDALYLNAFVVNDHYTPAARDPEKGGVLANAGILFDAPGMGRLGSALSNESHDAAGLAFGWQAFRKLWRRQLILELAARTDLDGSGQAEAAVGARFQQAMGTRTILQLDGFAAAHEHRSNTLGARVEFLVKF